VVKTASYKPDLYSSTSTGGPWTGNDTYDSSIPANQAQNTLIDNNKLITYYYRLQNDGTYDTPSYTVTGTTSGGGWIITYYEDTNLNGVIDGADILRDPAGWASGVVTKTGYTQLIANHRLRYPQRCRRGIKM
jgi:hypothetical protein